MVSNDKTFRLIKVLTKFDILLDSTTALEFVNKKDLDFKETIWYKDKAFIDIIDYLYENIDNLPNKEFCGYSFIFKEKLYLEVKIPKYKKYTCTCL